MKYLHTMVRVRNLEASIHFFCDCLGLVQVRRNDYEDGRFTLCYLAAPEDIAQANRENSPLLELTYNWDDEHYPGGRNFGHLAFEVNDIYQTCQKLMDAGVTINRPPRDGGMAFVRSPDNISIELLQRGSSLATTEPWSSMPNIGEW